MKQMQKLKLSSISLVIIVSLLVAVLCASIIPSPAYAATCGGVETTINFGCRGSKNPVLQLLLAIVRFLTAGVGIVLVGSGVFAGIQYTSSRGDPKMIADAKKRILNIMIALLVYLLAFAGLNFLIPGGIL